MTPTTDLSDRHVDVTDKVQMHASGKILYCECGQRIGVSHGSDAAQCAVCDRILVDTRAGERDTDVHNVQSTLDAW